MSKIIMLVIAFQVIMGLYAKWKARQKAEEAARGPSDRNAANPPIAGETPAGGVFRQPSRAPTAWGGGHSDDEEDEEWDEHHMRGEGGHADSRTQPRRLPEEGSLRPQPGSSNKGKAAEVGKDLLSQLAKELGLEIPTGSTPKPRPVPRPQPAPSAPPANKTSKPYVDQTKADREAALRARTAMRETERHTEISRRAAKDAQSRAARQDAGETTPRRDPRSIGATQDPKAASASVPGTARASLMDVKSLRNALILKTILDKPLSLQPRRPGQD
ncbi:MAG: hypothetical protein JWP91_3733 [Fibrobacteres bacterium]|nr:hypothetical protein [Fibrobacterota bacterium]